jgi:hypothetical protein
VRAARSSMRGLAPLGLGGSWGSSGSITSHSSATPAPRHHGRYKVSSGSPAKYWSLVYHLVHVCTED